MDPEQHFYLAEYGEESSLIRGRRLEKHQRKDGLDA